MGRVYIRKSKTNSDNYEVMDGKTVKGRHMVKANAKKQAEAIRRVKKKRAKRLKK